MIAIDSTLLVQIVAFLIFWFLLTRLLFKPFLRLIGEREQRTEETRRESASLKEEAERLRKQYEDAMARGADEGRAIKEGIVGEARRTRERLLSRAREDAAGTLKVVREEIQRELKRGREVAAGEAQAIAQQMAEKILGRKIG